MSDWNTPLCNQSADISLFQIAAALQKISDSNSALERYIEELDDNIKDLQEEIDEIKQEIRELQ